MDIARKADCAGYVGFHEHVVNGGRGPPYCFGQDDVGAVDRAMGSARGRGGHGPRYGFVRVLLRIVAGGRGSSQNRKASVSC